MFAWVVSTQTYAPYKLQTKLTKETKTAHIVEAITPHITQLSPTNHPDSAKSRQRSVKSAKTEIAHNKS